jgi:transposase
MTFIIEQKIKNHIYFYEVESYWDPDKKQARQKRRYLGKKDPLSGQVVTPLKSHTPKHALGFGPIYVLHKVAQDCGLEKALIDHFGPHAQQILLWAYFKMTEQKAGYLFEEWGYDNFLPYALKPLSSQALSRWFQTLEKMDTQRAGFFKEWAHLHGRDKALWFDITSLSSYAQTNTWCEWGYNRDGESLPQVNLGMVMGMDSELPLFYQVYPGSISDVSTLRNIAHQTKAWGTKLHTFILDRGFYSASNLALLKSLDLHFILPLPAYVKISQVLLSQVKNTLTSPLNSLSYEGQPIFALPTTIEINDQSLYATVYFDPQRYTQESTRFYRRLHEIEVYIDQGTFYTRDQVVEALESSWAGSSRFFTIKLEEEGHVKLSRKRNALSWRLNRMGKMILLSDQQYSPLTLLEWYRKKDCVEKVFDTLKNELGERRLRVHSVENMQGKLFLNFIAVCIYTALRKRMNGTKKGQRFTIPEVLMHLRKWRVLQFDDQKQIFTEIPKQLKNLLQDLNIPIPLFPRY